MVCRYPEERGGRFHPNLICFSAETQQTVQLSEQTARYTGVRARRQRRSSQGVADAQPDTLLRRPHSSSLIPTGRRYDGRFPLLYPENLAGRAKARRGRRPGVDEGPAWAKAMPSPTRHLDGLLLIHPVIAHDDAHRRFSGKPEEEGIDNRNDQTAEKRRPETIDAKLHPQTTGDISGQ